MRYGFLESMLHHKDLIYIDHHLFAISTKTLRLKHLTQFNNCKLGKETAIHKDKVQIQSSRRDGQSQKARVHNMPSYQ